MNQSALLLTLPFVLAGSLAAQQGADRDLQRRITPIVEVVRQARPAVVFIQSDVPFQRRDWLGRTMLDLQTKSGSGFVIEPDGYIVTNFHVVSGAQRIQVAFDDEDDPKTYTAKLLSKSEENDLALLKIDGRDDFPFLQPGSNDPLLGETVIAIGNPYGQTHTVSSGIISGLHRDVQAGGLRFTNLLQTDASINPGNSGGPLLNVNGELVGINTAMNVEAENIGFAIPVDQLKRVLNETLLSPDLASAWLGFELQDEESLVIASITPGGPAASAGLRAGDRLVSLGGRKLDSPDDYRLALIAVQPFQDVAVQARRGERTESVSLRAWDFFDGYLWERLGMTLAVTRMGSGLRPYLQVTSVQDDGPAEKLGLVAGDVIEAVRPPRQNVPRKVASRDQLAWLINRLAPRSELEVFVMQDRDKDGRFRLQGDDQERFKGSLSIR